MEEYITIEDSFIVNLSSKNGEILNYPFNSSVKFLFNEPIARGNSRMMYCALLNFISSNSLYTINDTNCILSITINNIQTDYIITYGFYDCNNFMIELIKVLGPSFSITLDLLTNKYTLINLVNDFTINPSTIYNVFGLKKYTFYSSINKTFTCPYMCNFNGVQAINIELININTNNIDSMNGVNSSIIQSISVDNSIQQIIYEKKTDFKFIITDDYISQLIIDIKDDSDNFVNFNSKFFNMTLQFTLINNILKFDNETFHSVLGNYY